jgi:hypothetical protein
MILSLKEIDMRKLIAGMKISVDGKMEGPQGYADWVEAWSEDYDLMSQVDACVVGGGMYPHYEQYWTTIQNEPDKPHWLSNRIPTPAEVEWARFAAQTPHDELRLIVYPLIATTERRNGLELRKVQQLQGGRVSLIYAIG